MYPAGRSTLCECTDPLDDTRDARWISLISITMKHAVLIRRIMWQKHGQGPLSRCDMKTCRIRASTTVQTKRKEARMQTESKIQGNKCLSQRPEGHCLSQRRDNTASRRGGNTVSRRDGTKMPLAEAGRKTKKNKWLFPHHGTRDTFDSHLLDA